MSLRDAMAQEAFWVGMAMTIIALVALMAIIIWASKIVDDIKKNAVREYLAQQEQESTDAI